jgi:hypothetical protein
MKLSELPWMDQVKIHKAFSAMPKDVDVIFVAPGSTTVFIAIPPLSSGCATEAERRASQYIKQKVELWKVTDSDIIGGWDGSHAFFMWRRAA